MSWAEKYRPSSFFEIKGQEEAIAKSKLFIEGFPRTKAIILYGPPGTGKTTLAHTIAKETNSEIFELNASDLRNRNKLQEILRPAIEQKSLFKEKKIILIDEVDGISTTDWGGLSELLKLINTTSYPIIITANDIWKKQLSDLRRKSLLVQLKEIDYQTIKNILIDILRKEDRFLSNDNLTKISIKAHGDLRAAINDIQAESGVSSQDISVDERNKETDIFNAMRLIFKGKPTEDTIKVFDSVNMSIDEIMLWIEENIPLEYKGEDMARAVGLLSKTDIFKKRIYRQQYWRFLLYENFFLSYGISASKKEIKLGFTSYRKPERILKIWINNQRSAKKKSISKKYAHYVHVGEKRAMGEFPIIKQIILKSPEIARELRLTKEEIEYLEK